MYGILAKCLRRIEFMKKFENNLILYSNFFWKWLNSCTAKEKKSFFRNFYKLSSMKNQEKSQELVVFSYEVLVSLCTIVNETHCENNGTHMKSLITPLNVLRCFFFKTLFPSLKLYCIKVQITLTFIACV